jgi:DNA-binding CsgD family transcriptional regulator
MVTDVMHEPPSPAPVAVRGRRAELEALETLVAQARAGRGGALVLRGDAGVGKTALLEALTARVGDGRVVRVAGVEGESGLSFAGLHLLCASFLDRLERLPGPQREALDLAFGLRSGPEPDRFLVGMAVLGLMSVGAGDDALICLVDDAQWLDPESAQALVFAARHATARAIAMVFVVRAPADPEHLRGLPELLVGDLGDRDARAVLRAAVTGPLDARVRDRIVAEARGNPRALLEIPRRLTPEELAGGFGRPDRPGLSGRSEAHLRRRVEALPDATRTLLLVVAAEPVLDPVRVWRAAARLGVGPDAAAPASGARLIDAGGQLRFRHPLARSAVYGAASPAERQAVHRALADVVDPEAEPDRRAWHRGHATAGLDEEVAAALERAVDGAGARGGVAAAAAFRRRAAELTPDPARRARRALAAAQAKREVGAWDAAARLLAEARSGPLDALLHAQAELLEAQLAEDFDRVGDVPPLLLAAARRLEDLDPALSRETYRDAFSAAMTAGRLAAGGGGMRDVAAAAPSERSRRPAATEQLLQGAGTLITDGHAAGAPPLREALGRLCANGIADEEALRWLPLACRMAHATWDDERWLVLSTALTQLARENGVLTMLSIGLVSSTVLDAFAGDLAGARRHATEAQAVGTAIGQRLGPYGALVIAAWEGDQAELTRQVVASTDAMTARGEGQWLTAVDWARALLGNGLGRYADALGAAARAAERSDEPGWASWALAEYAEAAARTGMVEQAADAVRRLDAVATACGTDWALGVAARSSALIAAGKHADALYQEAIERLEGTRVRAELGRAYLVHGEWLRREGRRAEARKQLRSACELLEGMGARGFAERARRELMATGEIVRKRTDEARDDLTPQELRIARLARDGHTNPQIGGQLFLSARTVEWHLRKVFMKLGIGSRRELGTALVEVEAVGAAA